ncbi:MAG: anti-sigma factor antagonist [Actinobacteria bacterium]|nr:anti-sigma factor antagonist [Actinomycetota bacterium]
MPEQRFDAQVRQEGSVATMDLSGEINRGADDRMTSAYDDVAKTGAATILLNFTRVGYINSTGIAVIVAMLGRARNDGRQVSAYGLTDHYKHLFDITRLSDFMNIYDDESTALAGVGAGA